jgi:hypothetical protein
MYSLALILLASLAPFSQAVKGVKEFKGVFTRCAQVLLAHGLPWVNF